MNSNSYSRKIFFHSVRTAIIFVAGFMIYEILLELEEVWNKANPGRETYNFHKRNILKFIIIFLIDFALLYALYWFFDAKF